MERRLLLEVRCLAIGLMIIDTKWIWEECEVERSQIERLQAVMYVCWNHLQLVLLTDDMCPELFCMPRQHCDVVTSSQSLQRRLLLQSLSSIH